MPQVTTQDWTWLSVCQPTPRPLSHMIYSALQPGAKQIKDVDDQMLSVQIKNSSRSRTLAARLSGTLRAYNVQPPCSTSHHFLGTSNRALSSTLILKRVIQQIFLSFLNSSDFIMHFSFIRWYSQSNTRSRPVESYMYSSYMYSEI